MGRRSDHTREELHRMALDAALAIVREQGLRGLSVRGIATRIGYVGGTLYQLFTDLDDLIITMNAESIEMLYGEVKDAALPPDPAEALIVLAEIYMRTVRADANRWNAVFEYNPPIDRTMPARYTAAVASLLQLVGRVMAPLFRPGEEAQRMHEVRVLWSSLYGIATLASSRKSSVELDSSGMVRSLATNYIAGLRAAGREVMR